MQRNEEFYSGGQQAQKAVVVEMFNPEQTAEQEQLQMIHHYIDNSLPQLSQQILRLRYQHGLKYREIADVLQVSEVTVHNHLSQSLKLLKDHFKSLGYGIK
jgi:RNA polymerase sigma-70 factor (ECF subfamily)